MLGVIMDPAKTAGPAGDGSNSLAKESKAGIAVAVVVGVVVDSLTQLLMNIDADSLEGQGAKIGAALAAALAGLYTAYKKRNR